MSIDYGETAAYAPSNAWNLYLGQNICGDVQAALNREWFATNGLGGYAGSSIAGATTRSYHGLLVASLRPPVERTVLVTKLMSGVWSGCSGVGTQIRMASHSRSSEKSVVARKPAALAPAICSGSMRWIYDRPSLSVATFAASISKPVAATT